MLALKYSVKYLSNEEIIEDWAMGSQCKAGGDLIEKA
jgi:hypothetical protein